MSSQHARVTTGAAALVLATTLGFGLGQVGQPDLETRVKALEEERAKTAEAIETMEAKIATLENQAKASEAWMAGLPPAVEALDKGLKKVVEQGFINAGLNLPARETLLASIRAFGNSMKQNLPRAAQAEPDPKRRR